MSSFDDEFAAGVVSDQFDQFGRTITFRPAAGAARSVEMILGPVERADRADEYEEEEREELWVEVRRDASHASGGIATPRMGDAFTHPDEPGDPTPFVWQGTRRNVNPTTHELLFGRPVHEGRGFVSRGGD